MRPCAGARYRLATFAWPCQVPIWPGAVPDAMPNPKPESVSPAGREWWPRANDVSVPTMTVYAPMGRNTGVAVVVFPGGGYQFLAMDLEGTEICDWLNAKGMTCVLLSTACPTRPDAKKDTCTPEDQTAVQDAQRTSGLRASTRRSGIRSQMAFPLAGTSPPLSVRASRSGRIHR